MQSSWERHNMITYLCYLIYLTSIGNTSIPPLIECALPDDLQERWWEWGNNSMYRRCLQLAWWWLEYDPLWWKGRFRPTSAQCPQVGAFRFSFSIPFSFVWNRNSPPSQWWKTEKICSAVSISDHSITYWCDRDHWLQQSRWWIISLHREIVMLFVFSLSWWIEYLINFATNISNNCMKWYRTLKK